MEVCLFDGFGACDSLSRSDVFDDPRSVFIIPYSRIRPNHQFKLLSPYTNLWKSRQCFSGALWMDVPNADIQITWTQCIPWPFNPGRCHECVWNCTEILNELRGQGQFRPIAVLPDDALSSLTVFCENIASDVWLSRLSAPYCHCDLTINQ